jgi:hypothetical protein
MKQNLNCITKFNSVVGDKGKNTTTVGHNSTWNFLISE